MDILLAMLVYFGLTTSPEMTSYDMQYALATDAVAAPYYIQFVDSQPDPSLYFRVIDRRED